MHVQIRYCSIDKRIKSLDNDVNFIRIYKKGGVEITFLIYLYYGAMYIIDIHRLSYLIFKVFYSIYSILSIICTYVM